MSTVQMNTRINTELKRSGDAILRRNGYSPSSAVQALWAYICDHKSLPDFMPPKAKALDKTQQLQAIRSDEGMAFRLFNSLTGYDLDPRAPALSDDELREAEWAEQGAFDD